ncbi:MAG: hypothetical protein AAF628_31395 [Planctomycetota bacterium]
MCALKVTLPNPGQHAFEQWDRKVLSLAPSLPATAAHSGVAVGSPHSGFKLSFRHFLFDSAAALLAMLLAWLSYYVALGGAAFPVAAGAPAQLLFGILLLTIAPPLGLAISAVSWFVLGHRLHDAERDLFRRVTGRASEDAAPEAGNGEVARALAPRTNGVSGKKKGKKKKGLLRRLWRSLAASISGAFERGLLQLAEPTAVVHRLDMVAASFGIDPDRWISRSARAQSTLDLLGPTGQPPGVAGTSTFARNACLLLAAATVGYVVQALWFSDHMIFLWAVVAAALSLGAFLLATLSGFAEHAAALHHWVRLGEVAAERPRRTVKRRAGASSANRSRPVTEPRGAEPATRR